MKIFRLLSLLLVVLLASCLNKKKSADTGIPGNESRYVVLAYVTSWGVSTPETSCLTHINYAFGHVADDNSLNIFIPKEIGYLLNSRERSPKYPP